MRTYKQISSVLLNAIRTARTTRIREDNDFKKEEEELKKLFTEDELMLFKAVNKVKKNAMNASLNEFLSLAENVTDNKKRQELNMEHLNRNTVNNNAILKACSNFTSADQVEKFSKTFTPKVTG